MRRQKSKKRARREKKDRLAKRTLWKVLYIQQLTAKVMHWYPFGQRILPGRSAGAIFIPLDRHKVSDIFRGISV